MNEEDLEIYICQNTGCRREFSEDDFDNVDAELDEQHPRCPECQLESEIESKECEHCDKPAVQMTDAGSLCEDHFEDYAGGYVRD